MNTERRLSRRQFVALGGAGLAVAGGATAWMARGRNPGHRPTARYEYDLAALSRIDPAWIHYREIASFSAPLAKAVRVAAGPEDRLLIAGERGVAVLDAAGVLERVIATEFKPRALAADSAGALFVGGGRQVEAYSLDGARLFAWTPMERRSFVTGLTAHGEELWVADAGNRVVLRCDRSGRLIRKIGEPDRDRGVDGFVVPSPCFDVKMGEDGLLRAANPGRHRVELYSEEGDLELAWGEPGFGLAGFAGCCNPAHLALFPDGRVVTFEKGLPRVKVYGANGNLESVAAAPDTFPENLQSRQAVDFDEGKSFALDGAVDSRGRIHILDPVSNLIRVMERIAPSTAQPSPA